MDMLYYLNELFDNKRMYNTYLGCKKMEEVDLNDILRRPFLLVKRLIKKLSMFFVPKPRAEACVSWPSGAF